MTRRFWFLVLGLLMLVLTGCGNGGSNGIIRFPVTTTTPAQPASTITIPVDPGQSASARVDNTTAVEVPRETYPNGGNLTITTAQTANPTDIPDFEEVGNKAYITITSSVKPAGSIVIKISDLKSKPKDAKYLYFLAQKTSAGVWDSLNDLGKQLANSTELVIDTSRWVNNTICGIIGRIPVSNYSETVEMVKIGQDDELAPADRLGLFIHGINADANNMQFAAQKIKQEHFYRQIYIFSYDWRRDGASVATDLGKKLNELYTQGFHSIDIIAHSRGVLISRYALEILGKTAAVRSLYAICGPNKGANFASAVDLLRALRLEYINLTRSDLPFGIADFDSPALHEMIAGSEFLTKLNEDKRNFQRGYVHYSLLSAGSKDQWVSPSSALAKDICMYALTSGTVETFDYGRAYNHGGLIQTSSGVAEIIKIVNRKKENRVTISSDAAYYNPESDGWRWSATIKNNSDYVVATQDVTIDSYDRYGEWTGVQWYSPIGSPGDQLPYIYTTWNKYLNPGESVKINVQTLPDSQGHSIDQVEERFKAKAKHVIVRYFGNETYQTTTCFIKLCNGSITPERPNQRSRQTIVISGKIPRANHSDSFLMK